MSDVDRQASLNMCYDALEDLTFALDISDTSIAFNGELAIAFGSRGRGAAVAHYEPLRQVINITKMKGAGSLAHEWWHALDDHLGEVLGVHDFVSASRDVYPLMDKLVNACKYKTNPETGRKVKTDFLKGSEAMEKSYAKFGNGYWSDDIELTARAFACYVKDKVSFRSDYLVGHADTAATEDSKAYPVGEERKIINLPPNRVLEDEDGNVLDIIQGTFFLIYAPQDSDDFETLPANLLRKYERKYKIPHVISFRRREA